MKTNVLMKIAIVFMAAFGAYAFSGKTNTNSKKMFSRSDTCENILVGCSDSGDYICKVELLENESVVDVWDLNCIQEVYHENDTILPEEPQS